MSTGRNLEISGASLGEPEKFQCRSALPTINYNCTVLDLFLRQMYSFLFMLLNLFSHRQPLQTAKYIFWSPQNYTNFLRMFTQDVALKRIAILFFLSIWMIKLASGSLQTMVISHPAGTSNDSDKCAISKNSDLYTFQWTCLILNSHIILD